MNGPIQGAITAGSTVALLARVRGANGQLITQSSVASIGYQVVNLATGAIVDTGTFSPTSAVFNSLVTNDPRWTCDSQQQPGADGASGYNFLGTLPGADFATTTPAAPGLSATTAPVFQCDVRFTGTDGTEFRLSFQFTAYQVYY